MEKQDECKSLPTNIIILWLLIADVKLQHLACLESKQTTFSWIEFVLHAVCMMSLELVFPTKPIDGNTLYAGTVIPLQKRDEPTPSTEWRRSGTFHLIKSATPTSPVRF